MNKVNCSECQFYNAGRCEELGEYTTPRECECSLFSQKINKKPCFAKCEKSAKQTVFDQITQSPEVLAEKLVYLVRDSYNWAANYYWCSTVADGVWKTKQEALASTAAKLKGIEG